MSDNIETFVQLSSRIPPELMRQLNSLAQELGETKTEIIIRALWAEVRKARRKSNERGS